MDNMQKVFLHDDKYYCCAGEYAKALSLIDYLLDVSDSKVDCEGCEVLVVDKVTKRALLYSNSLRPFPVEAPFAMGTGAAYALAIMLHHIDIDDRCLLDMSAIEAVDMARRLDPYTGGEIKIYET